jgi:hypothetical protein
VLDDSRMDIAQVDLIDTEVPDAMIPVNVHLDRRGLGWILLQGRQSGLGFPGTDLE